MQTLAPGTRVTLDAESGTWHGRVVVCLCKRHVWQPELRGTECGHAYCNYPPAPEACPWPVHVVWSNGTTSHESAGALTPA